MKNDEHAIDVQSFPFEKIRLDYGEDWGTIHFINFQANRYGFFLSFDKKTHQPEFVYHEGYKHRERCPLCRKSTVKCDVLNKKIDLLFEVLTNHSSIRLEWLFLSKGV